MRCNTLTIAVAFSTLVFVSISSSQETDTTAVPNFINYSGNVKILANGLGSASTVGVTFAIYRQQDGGAPIWLETQNVKPDSRGQYDVLLGSTRPQGLPADLFSDREQRWLGVEVQGQPEQARVLLVSVPYAFKAHDAETLGGLPASAFMRAAPSNGDGVLGVSAPTNPINISIPGQPAPGTLTPCASSTGFIPYWSPAPTLCDSDLFQGISPAGPLVGVGTTNPMAKLDVNGSVNAAGVYKIKTNTVLAIGDPNLLNTFVGVNTGPNNTTGFRNTFVGLNAGLLNTTSDRNTFVGMVAGQVNTTGSHNTFLGQAAGFANTTGNRNTFTGRAAGSSNTTGSFNVFDGYQAGNANLTTNNNTFVGFQSGFNSTADNNIFFGYRAGFNNTIGSNDLYIANPGPSAGNESNTIRIGDPAIHSATFMAGIAGATVTGVPVYVNTNTGQLGVASSSRRFKEQIQDMGDSSSALMKLRPVTFLYKVGYEKGQRARQFGLIAEEVAEVYPDLVAYEPDGKPYTVKYQFLTTMLLNEAQKQYHRAEAEAVVITMQQEKIEAQQQQIEQIQQRLSRLETVLGKVTQVRAQN